GGVSHRRDLTADRLAERVHRSDIEGIRSVTERNHDAVVTGGVSRGGRAGRVVVDLGKCHRRAGRDRAGEVHRLVTGDPVVEGIVCRVEIDADDRADRGTRAQVHSGKCQVGGGDYAVTEDIGVEVVIRRACRDTYERLDGLEIGLGDRAGTGDVAGEIESEKVITGRTVGSPNLHRVVSR